MILYFRLNLDHSSVQDVQRASKQQLPLKNTKSHIRKTSTQINMLFCIVKSAAEMCITNGIHDENIISALSSYQINIKSITALKDYLNSLHSNKQC